MAKSRLEMFGVFVAVFMPLLGTLTAIELAIHNGSVSQRDLMIMVGMYLATGFGVTIGYHRMLTHRSFQPILPVKALFLALGSMAMQGPALFWALVHMHHHAHSDKEGDPHSPWWWKGLDLHFYTTNFWRKASLRVAAFWHSHMGWLFSTRLPWESLTSAQQGLRADKMAVFFTKTFIFWVGLRFVICYLLGGWTAVLWGGCVCILLLQQVTYLVNSLAHTTGQKDFITGDESRNNLLVAFLGLGDGWHNGHHAFMWSARHGLCWWQIDVSYLLIWLMARIRLVCQVRVPNKAQLLAKQL